jgi:hypothetical protein
MDDFVYLQEYAYGGASQAGDGMHAGCMPPSSESSRNGYTHGLRNNAWGFDSAFPSNSDGQMTPMDTSINNQAGFHTQSAFDDNNTSLQMPAVTLAPQHISQNTFVTNSNLGHLHSPSEGFDTGNMCSPNLLAPHMNAHLSTPAPAFSHQHPSFTTSNGQRRVPLAEGPQHNTMRRSRQSGITTTPAVQKQNASVVTSAASATPDNIDPALRNLSAPKQRRTAAKKPRSAPQGPAQEKQKRAPRAKPAPNQSGVQKSKRAPWAKKDDQNSGAATGQPPSPAVAHMSASKQSAIAPEIGERNTSVNNNGASSVNGAAGNSTTIAREVAQTAMPPFEHILNGDPGTQAPLSRQHKGIRAGNIINPSLDMQPGMGDSSSYDKVNTMNKPQSFQPNMVIPNSQGMPHSKPSSQMKGFAAAGTIHGSDSSQLNDTATPTPATSASQFAPPEDASMIHDHNGGVPFGSPIANAYGGGEEDFGLENVTVVPCAAAPPPAAPSRNNAGASPATSSQGNSNVTPNFELASPVFDDSRSALDDLLSREGSLSFEEQFAVEFLRGDPRLNRRDTPSCPTPTSQENGEDVVPTTLCGGGIEGVATGNVADQAFHSQFTKAFGPEPVRNNSTTDLTFPASTISAPNNSGLSLANNSPLSLANNSPLSPANNSPLSATNNSGLSATNNSALSPHDIAQAISEARTKGSYLSRYLRYFKKMDDSDSSLTSLEDMTPDPNFSDSGNSQHGQAANVAPQTAHQLHTGNAHLPAAQAQTGNGPIPGLTFRNQAEAVSANLGPTFTPVRPDHTLPQTDQDRQRIVLRLLQAMRNRDDVLDKGGNVFNNRWLLQDDNGNYREFYDEHAEEKVCWDVLVCYIASVYLSSSLTYIAGMCRRFA